MARSNKNKKDILLLYCKEDDTEPWMEYITQCLTEVQKDLVVQTVDIKERLQNITSICSGAVIVCLVVSPSFLETMENQVDILRPCLGKHVISVIELFLEPGQFESQIASLYSVDKWKHFEFGHDHPSNNQVAKDIVNIVNKTKKASALKGNFAEELSKKLVKQKSGEPVTAKKGPADADETGVEPSEPKGATAKVVESKPAKDSILREIYPNCIRQADEKVALIFKREIDEGHLIQIKIDEKIYDTERLNPYCYSFKAPAHREGKVTSYIQFNGKKVCKRYLWYMSPANMAYTCPQYLVELLGLRDLKGLDDELAKIFISSVPGDSALNHILTPKNIAATAGQTSMDQLPTLLHFACYYGLQHLCTSITDLPGSDYALQMCNVDNKTPLDLAREGGFEEMVMFLEDFKEMQIYMDNLEDLYTRMGGKKDLSGYMEMSGGRRVMDDYDIGRITGEEEYISLSPSQPEEDDYEIKAPNMQGCDCVEEVLSDEDEHDPKPDYVDLKETASVEIPPARPPKPQNQQVTDVFREVIKMPQASLGSSSLDELRDMQEAFKHQDLTLDDIETLYKAWQHRNQNCTSRSIKERQKKIQDMKLDVLKKAPKQGFFSRLTQKKQTSPIASLNIQHNVNSNAYSTLPRSYPSSSRPNSNRDSTTSTSSTSSYSSSGSRQSNLDFTIDEEDDDDETPTPPPRPANTLPGARPSRLPTPPMSMYSHVKLQSPPVPPRKY